MERRSWSLRTLSLSLALVGLAMTVPIPAASAQAFPEQPAPGQPVPSQPVPSQPVPSQPVPSQPVPSQTAAGQAAAGLSGAADGPTDLEELVSNTSRSVVLLRVYDGFDKFVGSGTGFYVRDGVLATNHHVIEPASKLVAVVIDGTEVAVENVLAEDPVHDLALLSLPPGPPALPLFTGRVRAGQQVAVIGSPQGLAGTLSTGIVSAVRENGLENELPGPLIQIDAAISKGSSGSPVMNLRGEVIGVAVAVLVNGQNLNFAVPVEKLMELELSMGVEQEPLRRVGDKRGSWIRNSVLSLVVFAALVVGLRRLR